MMDVENDFIQLKKLNQKRRPYMSSIKSCLIRFFDYKRFR